MLIQCTPYTYSNVVTKQQLKEILIESIVTESGLFIVSYYFGFSFSISWFKKC